MKRNKSADDVLSPGLLHDEEEFFSQLGSHSASSSRENITSFTIPDNEPAAFQAFHNTRTKSPENAGDLFGGNVQKPASPDLFDPFSFKGASEKPSNNFDPFASKKGDSEAETFDLFVSKQGSTKAETLDPFAAKQDGSESETFNPFGSKSGQSSSSTETFQPFGSKTSGTNLGSFDPFGAKSTAASGDFFGIGTSQGSSGTTQTQTKGNGDLFGDWGDTSAATPLQPNKVPSPTPSRKTNGSVPQSKATPADPFADFGNLKSSLPRSSSGPKFPTATSTSPKTKKKPGPSANASWSRPAQQPSWQSGAKPASSSKTQNKPNYTPSYSMSGSSGVFGNYGQKWNGE